MPLYVACMLTQEGEEEEEEKQVVGLRMRVERERRGSSSTSNDVTLYSSLYTVPQPNSPPLPSIRGKERGRERGGVALVEERGRRRSFVVLDDDAGSSFSTYGPV